MPLPTALDKWLKKATPDDTGLTRPPVAMHVSAHKDEVRSIVHGYFRRRGRERERARERERERERETRRRRGRRRRSG